MKRRVRGLRLRHRRYEGRFRILGSGRSRQRRHARSQSPAHWCGRSLSGTSCCSGWLSRVGYWQRCCPRYVRFWGT